MTDPAVMSEARDLFLRAQEQWLAESPLADMAAWVRSGRAPSAETLRQCGLAGLQSLDHSRFAELRFARQAYIRRWGFAIPCAEMIAALAGCGPMVEVGAGTGYLTAMLRAAGCDVVATDVQTEGKIGYGFAAAAHAPVERLGAAEAVAAYAERDVLCAWPTQDHEWAAEAARLIRPRRTLALIAEPPGGCTGTPDLYKLLAEDFELIETVEIPQFPKVDDRLTIHRRR